MKKQRGKLLLIFALLLSLAVVMTNCGGGGGGGSSSDSGGGGTTDQTAPESQQAASGGGQSTSVASGSTETFTNLSNVGLSSVGGTAMPQFRSPKSIQKDAGLGITSRLAARFAKSKAVQAAVSGVRKAAAQKAQQTFNGSGTCTDGGSYSYTGTYDDVTQDYNLTFTFSNCREDTEQYDGEYTLVGTSLSFSITLGNSTTPFTIYEYDTAGTLVYSTTANITMSISSTGSSTQTGGSFTMTVDGDMTAHDYVSGEDYSMTFSSFTVNVSWSVDANGVETMTVTVNGGVNESWTSGGTTYTLAISYTDFSIQNVDYSANAGTDYDDTSINGTVAINFTPDAYCFEGTFTIATVTPIRWDNSVGHTVAGQITINTTVVITWNSDGTVTVTENGTTVYTGSIAGLYSTCDFAALDGDSETASGGTSGSASGTTMTITSQSTAINGGTLSCYTDLHVNYYSTTAPTSTTTGTWYIDWHQMDTSNPDINGDGVNDFEQYLDITGDGIADVGLDINGADTDDTLGGLEHFYATVLPDGYYVVSMNNFSCYDDIAGVVTASNSVSIQIGSTTFGPFQCDYTSADYEAADPGAWCAVADIVVSGGSATVQSHDPNLELWHDGAFGMYAPAAAKKLR